MRCWTPLLTGEPDLTATVTDQNTHRFEESDGVLDDTLYLCVVHQIYGSSQSVASEPVHFISLLDTSKCGMNYLIVPCFLIL